MEKTTYSKDIAGDKGNYNWKARFDKTTGGYIGLSQWQDDKLQRVLLSPAQVKALIEFLGVKPE